MATGPKRPFQPVLANLSGSGSLGLQPLAFDGRVILDRPQFLGVGGKRIAADVRYTDRRYALKGTVEPIAAGSSAPMSEDDGRGPSWLASRRAG